MDLLFRIFNYLAQAFGRHSDPGQREYWGLHKGFVVSVVSAIVCMLFAVFELSRAASQPQTGFSSITHTVGLYLGMGLLVASLIAIAFTIYLSVKIVLFHR